MPPRAIWDASAYIDREFLPQLQLPIRRDYALSLVETFIAFYAADLMGRAEEIAVKALHKANTPAEP